MFYLTDTIEFPDVSKATKDGLLAIGGDLSIERLLEAYRLGIFPWFEIDEPILWWSPDPRFVMYPEKLVVSKSMRQVMRKQPFEVTMNRSFDTVIKECSKVKRRGQSSSWITNGMIDAYIKFHEAGYAKSVEVWLDDELVGGLYGVDIGNSVFCGESMFTKVDNASKVALITLIQESDYNLIDCQVYTSHLESLGAEPISRETFLNLLR